MLLRELFEADGKIATVAFGRMNPPTIGHKKLADKVASLSGDPYIFLSQSQKPKTDPLDFATKVKFAKAFFPNVTIGSPDVKTIIQALQKLESMGYTDIIYVAGSDRIEDFTNLINKYNGKEYNFNNIKVVSAGERDPDAEGAEGMSASKMRAAAINGDMQSFAQGVPDSKLAQQMYDAVRAGMGINEIAGTLIKVGAKAGGKLAKGAAKKLGARKGTQKIAKKTGQYAGGIAGGAAEYKIAQKMSNTMTDKDV